MSQSSKEINERILQQRDRLRVELRRANDRIFHLKEAVDAKNDSKIFYQESMQDKTREIERLKAERGGLSPMEAVLILEDRKWPRPGNPERNFPPDHWKARLQELVDTDLRAEIACIREQIASKWTGEKPTEPGWYWFYGWTGHEAFTEKRGGAQLRTVEVIKSSNRIIRVMRGHFIEDFEEIDGVFSPIPLPKLPKEDK